MKTNKPSCYNCEYRGTVPGDCHSCCLYPGLDVGMFDFFSDKNVDIAKKLNVKGNAHGIKSGWFMWPVNFDPIWLENCDGFKKKE